MEDTKDGIGYDKLYKLYSKMNNESKVYTTDELLSALVNEVPAFATYMFKKAK